MTWPLGRLTAVRVPASDDAYFSIWRLAWVAHQLPNDPAHLFDANIFHPATGTLAYSDAMLLVGVIGMPLFELGINAGIVHNILLLIAMVSSMLCAFALARRLTGSDPAALIAAVMFGFAPYRIAHIGHLELQWTMWMPLAMLVLHRLAERPSALRGLLLGAVLSAQVLCSIYYGVFLACYLAAAWLMALWLSSARQKFVTSTLAAVAPLVIVAMIYGPPYLKTRAEFGQRGPGEVQMYSATPSDYLRVPIENALFGKRQELRDAPDERSLYPGTAAIALALVTLLSARTRLAGTYAALALIAVDLSFGANGILFQLLQLVADVTGSLRAPARAGVLALLSISMLAAMGAAHLFKRMPARAPLAALVLLLCIAEYWSGPLPTREYYAQPREVDQWLATHPPGTAVLQLPAPSAKTLWLRETEYQLRSIHHWQPLVNGYSAFPPRHYLELINQLHRFPEPHVIEMLRALKLRFIIVHREFYESDAAFNRVIEAAEASSRLWPVRAFGGGETLVRVFELNYEPE